MRKNNFHNCHLNHFQKKITSNSSSRTSITFLARDSIKTRNQDFTETRLKNERSFFSKLHDIPVNVTKRDSIDAT